MASVDPEQAKRVFQLVILTAMSDGEMGGTEAKSVAALRKTEPILATVNDLHVVGREVHERAGAIGVQDAMREVAAGVTGREYREAAFRICARVMQADGETDLEEAELLGDLQELFALSGDDVKRLLK